MLVTTGGDVGVLVAVGGLGVNVLVGVRVLVGVFVLVGVCVLVGVREGVGVFRLMDPLSVQAPPSKLRVTLKSPYSSGALLKSAAQMYVAPAGRDTLELAVVEGV